MTWRHRPTGSGGPPYEFVFHASLTDFVGVPDSLSLAKGGAQTLSLFAGPERAGFAYAVLGSISGTSPGFPLDPFVVPLNIDGYTLQTLVGPAGQPLTDASGVLDAAGSATATFALPAGSAPALARLSVHHAALVVEVLPALLRIAMVSDAVPLALVP